MKWITWRRWMLAPLMAVLVMGGAFAIAPVYAASSTYTVTDCSTGSLSDTSTGGFGWAVNQANANAGSTIAFSCAQTATPNVIDATSTIILSQTMTITGSGQNITFDGQTAHIVFDLKDSGIVTLTGLTIQHGIPAVKQDKGQLILTNSLLTNNTGSYGAIINYSGQEAQIVNCAFTNNTSGGGGAIQVIGPLIVSESTFANNSAPNNDGGALYVTGPLTVLNSTFVNNSAYQGGAIYTGNPTGPMKIAASTFTGNTDTLNGADVYSNSLQSTAIVDSILPDGTYVVPGTLAPTYTGTLTSAAFAAPITQTIAGVQQTVYPLADDTVAGAQVALSSMSSYGVTRDQLGDGRQSTTVVGAYDPLGLPAQQFSAQIQIVTITGGTIAETMENLPALSVTSNGFDQTVTGTLPVTVTDATGSGAGWHLTIQRTVFMNGSTPAPTIAATLTGIAGACVAGSTCTVAANAITGYPIAIPTASPVVFSDATANTGMGQMLDSAGFSIAIPANVFAATYSSTLTVAVVSGP